MKLAVGQQLYWVGRYGPPADVGVLKVGRKWATLTNGRRIAVDTLRSEGDTSSRCYGSREVYAAEQNLAAKWRELRHVLGGIYHPPRGVTIEQIEQAAALLQVSLPLPKIGEISQ